MCWTLCLLPVAALVNLATMAKAAIPCEEARLKCAYRRGCGGALSNYLEGCSGVLQGVISHCPEICQHALIALTSTDEGKDLMNCACNDDFCVNTKKRVDVCRPQVVQATRNETIVSCRVAEWICAADTTCSTALEYYNKLCRAMFHGKKCTYRCMNSISILQRQGKAAKLNSCKCDGHEPYDCPKIQKNMARLCFHKTETNEVQTTKRPPVLRDKSSANQLNTSFFNIIILLLLTKLLVAIT